MHPSLFLTLPLVLLALAKPDPEAKKKSKTKTKSCSKTQCVDYINSCGQIYGGCFPACGHHVSTPSFTDPGCLSTAPARVTASASVTTPCSASATCATNLCVDYVNDCGQWYSGCYCADEGRETPTFTEPLCPGTYAAARAMETA